MTWKDYALILLVAAVAYCKFSTPIFLHTPVRDKLSLIYAEERRVCEATHAHQHACRRWRTNNRFRGDNVNDHIRSFMDRLYMINITIGSKDEIFAVGLDTGSSSLFLVSPTCSTCDIHPRWNHTRKRFQFNESKTFQTDHVPFKLSYLGGKADGFIGNDTFLMGEWTVRHQDFVVVTNDSSSLENMTSDGLLGLAYPRRDHEEPYSVLEQSEKIETFCVFLGRNSLSETDTGGEITWNGFDSQHCEDNVTHVNLIKVGDKFENPDHLWMIQIDAFDGTQSEEGPWTAAIDTGASVIIGPVGEIEAFTYANGATKNDEGYYVAPCNRTFTTMIFSIDGHDYSVPPHHYILHVPNVTGCVLAVEYDTWGDTHYQWLLGQPFLRSHCTYFHPRDGRVGFATLKN